MALEEYSWTFAQRPTGEKKDGKWWRFVYPFGDTVRRSLSCTLWDPDPWLEFRWGCLTVIRNPRKVEGSWKIGQDVVETSWWPGTLCIARLPVDLGTLGRPGLLCWPLCPPCQMLVVTSWSFISKDCYECGYELWILSECEAILLILGPFSYYDQEWKV